MCFNRRRAGEASNIKLETARENTMFGEANEEVLKCLSKFEKAMVNCLSRFETRGKRGHPVPILMIKLMCRNVEIIADLENRHIMGIRDENKYLFAIPDTEDSKYRVHSIITFYAVECGAERPELLRSTKLRKHLATMTQVHNLSESELDIVAKFMGHDIRIHRKYYRLPEKTTELAKVGTLLNTLNEGVVDIREAEDMVLKKAESSTLELSEEEDSEDEVDVYSDDLECENTSGLSINLNEREDASSPSINLNNHEPTEKEFGSTEATPPKIHSVCIKVPWSVEELTIVKSVFKQFLGVDYLPSKSSIEAAQKKYVLLQKRKWSVIKDKIKYLQKTGTK